MADRPLHRDGTLLRISGRSTAGAGEDEAAVGREAGGPYRARTSTTAYPLEISRRGLHPTGDESLSDCSHFSTRRGSTCTCTSVVVPRYEIYARGHAREAQATCVCACEREREREGVEGVVVAWGRRATPQ